MNIGDGALEWIENAKGPFFGLRFPGGVGEDGRAGTEGVSSSATPTSPDVPGPQIFLHSGLAVCNQHGQFGN